MSRKPRLKGRPRMHNIGLQRKFAIIYATEEEFDLILNLSTIERKVALVNAALDRVRHKLPSVPIPEPATS